MRVLARIFPLLALLACWLPTPAQPQPQPQPQPAPRPAAANGLSGAEADRLAALLRDENRRAELLRTLEARSAAGRAQSGAAGGAPAPAPQGAAPEPAPAEAAPPAGAAAPAAGQQAAAEAPGAPAAPAEPLIAPNTVGAQILLGLSERMGALSDTLLRSARSVADLPSLWSGVANLARDPVARARIVDASWKLALLLGAGLAVEALVHRSLAAPRRRLEAAADVRWTWLRRAPLLVGRLLLDLVPIAGFALVALGLFGVVRPLPTTQIVGLTIGQTYVGARVAFALARTLFSPRSRG